MTADQIYQTAHALLNNYATRFPKDADILKSCINDAYIFYVETGDPMALEIELGEIRDMVKKI